MSKKLSVYTRQNSSGNWWCNTTLNGIDISFESDTIEKARLEMSVWLWHNGIRNNIDWRSPKIYVHTPEQPKHYYQRPKLDNL